MPFKYVPLILLDIEDGFVNLQSLFQDLLARTCQNTELQPIYGFANEQHVQMC